MLAQDTAKVVSQVSAALTTHAQPDFRLDEALGLPDPNF